MKTEKNLYLWLLCASFITKNYAGVVFSSCNDNKNVQNSNNELVVEIESNNEDSVIESNNDSVLDKRPICYCIGGEFIGADKVLAIKWMQCLHPHAYKLLEKITYMFFNLKNNFNSIYFTEMNIKRHDVLIELQKNSPNAFAILLEYEFVMHDGSNKIFYVPKSILAMLKCCDDKLSLETILAHISPVHNFRQYSMSPK